MEKYNIVMSELRNELKDKHNTARLDYVEGHVKKITEELVELRKRDNLLSALEAGGVDNWSGYNWSLEDYEDE